MNGFRGLKPTLHIGNCRLGIQRHFGALMGFFLVGAIFLHGGEGGAEVEGVGGGEGEGFAVGGEVVAVGEGDDGEADERFFVGAEFGVGDDGGAVGGAGEGDGVVWLEVVAGRFLCGGKE